jgi:uncharacterized protein (TIGR03067 family)
MRTVGRLCLLALIGGCVAAAPPARVDTKRIAALVRQLGDEEFDRREEATRALNDVGEPALPALRLAVAKSDNLEIRRRARRLTEVIAGRLAARDQARLEGTWDGISFELNGARTASDAKVVIDGGKSVSTPRNGGGQSRYTLRIVDATSMPRKVDFIDPNGLVWQAVYAFEGDKFIYCGSGNGRPDSLTTKAGDGRYKATLKRTTVKR